MEPIVTAALIGAGSSALNSGGDWLSQNRQMDFSREMMHEANQFSLDMWNRTNEYNDPKNQVQRLRDAGLNPMFYGLDGSSANSFESAQPLGYQRASLNVGNPLESMVSAAQIENIKADTAQKRSNTSAIELDNEFKQKTMDVRVEGEKLANASKAAGIKLTDAQRDEALKHIDLMEEQAATEESKQFLNRVHSWVEKAQYWQIRTLTPYDALLKEASSIYQKAAASLATYNAAIQEGLYYGGFVEFSLGKLNSETEKNWSEISSIDANITLKEAQAEVQKWVNRIHNGEAINIDEIPKWMLTGRLGAYIWNTVLQRSSELTSAASSIIAPVAGVAAGKGVLKAAGNSYNANNSNSSFSAYPE